MWNQKKETLEPKANLRTFKAGIRALTQQLDNTKNNFDIVQLELTHSYILQKKKKKTPAHHSSRANSLCLVQRNKGGNQSSLKKHTSDSAESPINHREKGVPSDNPCNRAWFGPQRPQHAG